MIRKDNLALMKIKAGKLADLPALRALEHCRIKT